MGEQCDLIARHLAAAVQLTSKWQGDGEGALRLLRALRAHLRLLRVMCSKQLRRLTLVRALVRECWRARLPGLASRCFQLCAAPLAFVRAPLPCATLYQAFEYLIQ